MTTDCCETVAPVFQIDSEVRLIVTITDPVTGALIDPVAVQVFLADPAGSISTSNPTRLSTGVYAYILTADSVGRWTYKFKATDPDITSPDQAFVVESSIFPGA